MKVLYLTGMYPTPAYPQKGIFCHEQVKALQNLGIEVTVVVPVTFYDREVKVKEWEYEGVTVRYVRFFKLPKALDFHRTGKSLFRRLDRALDLKSFDIYHADSPLPTGAAVMLASKKYGVPFIVHGHGLDVFFDESYEGVSTCDKIAGVCQSVYEKANAVVGVSEKVLDKIRQRVDLTGKAFVAYNGVDTEQFKPVEKQNTDTVTVISIGNLIPLKGHKYLLQAVKSLKDKGIKNMKCQIVGRGYLEDELKAQTSELGLLEEVEFKGYVPYEEVAALLKNSDIFVLPSYYEALGCVYLEAMACGIPAVGCYENGIDEIIENGESGYLVNNHDVEGLVDCLAALMDSDTREKVGKKAREKVVTSCQWKHSALALQGIYEQVCAVK